MGRRTGRQILLYLHDLSRARLYLAERFLQLGMQRAHFLHGELFVGDCIKKEMEPAHSCGLVNRTVAQDLVARVHLLDTFCLAA